LDYIGSKVKWLSWLFEIIGRSVPEPSGRVFLDGCSGSGVVSRAAARAGFQVVANDLMYFPATIANGSTGLTVSQQMVTQHQIERLNTLAGVDGYFFHNFSDEGEPPRFYFTAANARRIDHVRREIEQVQDPKVKDYLLYCGLEALSRTSNTTGVQAAFLKKFKARALDWFELRAEEHVPGTVTAYRRDILELLSEGLAPPEDILYLDPPYTGRQYGPNYHLYETFVRNDDPEPVGKTGLRGWKNECHSAFCVARKCLEFLVNVVAASKAPLVYLSYNSDGLVRAEDMQMTLSSFGKITINEAQQRRYRADTSKTRIYNQKPLVEYLFELHRD